MFGRSARLPVDLLFDTPKSRQKQTYRSYVADWKEAMQNAYEIVMKNSRNAANHNKQQHDKRIRSSVLDPGDRVLVQNLSERGGPGKIRAYWEDKIHIVVHRLSPESPVYEVKPDKSDGRSRTLHRTVLLPCDYLELDPTPQHRHNHPRQNSRPRNRVACQDYQHKTDEEENQDDSDTFPSFLPNAMPSLHHEFNRACRDEDTLDAHNMNPEIDTDSVEDQLEPMVPARSRSQSLSKENDPDLDDNSREVDNSVQDSPNGSQSSHAEQSQRPVRQR